MLRRHAQGHPQLGGRHPCEGDDVAGVVVLNQDITDGVRAEEALRESEARMRTVLDNLPVGVWFTDRQGRINYGNEAAQHIWAGARYVGPDEYGEYRGWFYETGQEIAPEEWAAARAARTGQSTLNELVEIACFDGTHKIVRNSAVAVPGEGDQLAGVVILNQDVTEDIRREEALRKTLERLRLATTAAGLGVFEWDVPADRAFWENERMYEIFGRPREEGAITKAQFTHTFCTPMMSRALSEIWLRG